MLDIKLIRDNPQVVEAALKKKGQQSSLAEVLRLDEERRKLLSEADTLKHERNTQSTLIGQYKREQKDTTELMEYMKTISHRIKTLDTTIAALEQQFLETQLCIPNMPHESVPAGSSADHNVCIRTWGEKRTFPFQPRDHVELSNINQIIDFSRGTKLSGSGFPLYTGLGARLERALINFMLDTHTKQHGYTEISPPFLVSRACMTGTGQLPKMECDMYRIESDDLFLIPTAEVPVTNMHREEIIPDKALPAYYCAYTPCFRREAGSYGKETKGIIRIHQFDKVELVKIVQPEHSYDELELLLNNAETILQQLQLPYRIMLLCAGDMSFAAAKCYDIEVWTPGQNAYLEVSSCSNFEDFQARRSSLRFRDSNGVVRYPHTLNGSGLALPRTVIALLENYQKEDGSIAIPEVLQRYM